MSRTVNLTVKPGAASRLHPDEHLADSSGFDGVVRGGSLVEGEPRQRQTGLFSYGERAVSHRGRHVLRGGDQCLLADGVQQQALPAHVLGEALANGRREAVAAVVGVVPDRAVIGDHVDVEPRVLGDRHFDDVIDAVGSDLANAVRETRFGVSEHVRGTRRARERLLLDATDGGDDGRPSPHGQLDRRVTDRPSPALHENRATAQRTRRKACGPELVHRERTVSRHRRNTEARTELERRAVGQRHGTSGGNHGVLGGGPRRALVLSEIDPHAIADREIVDALTDGIHRSCSVLIRRDLVGDEGSADGGAGLPVRGVHTRHGDTYAHLAAAGGRDVALDERKNGGVTGSAVDDRLHTQIQVRADTPHSLGVSRGAARHTGGMSSLVIADGVPFLPGDAGDAEDPGVTGTARGRAAIGVRDGRIVAIGDLADVRAAVGHGAEEIDAHGGLVTPGFVDAHVHLGVGAVDALRCDLAGAASPAEISERVSRFVSTQTGAWIVGGGWDPTLFAASGPRAADLDALVGDRPALLLDADHHAAWASSAALALAGVDARTPDPADGRIERDATGAPSGTLRDGAVQLVARLLPEPPTDDIARGILRLSRQLLAAGITGWQEAALGAYGGFPDFTDAYLQLRAAGTLQGRATGALWVPRDLTEDGVEAFVARTVERAAELAAAGFPSATAKLMLDGIVETRTAHLLEPYCGFAERGRSYFAPELTVRLVSALNAAGIAVHVHAIGDAAVRDALDAFAAVPDGVRRSVRNHVAHIQLIHADDVPRFGDLGVTANAQPFWACASALARQSTLPLIGPARADELYVFGSLARHGAALAMGSDWPVSTFDPWQGIHVAVTRRPPGEPDAEPLGPDESLSLRQAIHAYTAGSATLLGLGSGRLSVGEPADLAIADRNPFAGPDEAIHDTRTAITVLGGSVVAS